MKRAQLLQNILENFSRMKREMMVNAHTHQVPMGVTYSELIIIRQVYDHSGAGVKDIADNMCVSSSAVTQIVNKLIEKGLLIREDDVEDRRHLKLSLSENMKTEYEKIMKQQYEHMAQVFSSLTDEELEIFSKLSGKIILNIIK
jgi:DNA-binding MarR family transcriptional regulator